MLLALFAAAAALVAAEIVVIVVIAHAIGWLLTLALLVVSTVAGLWLVRIQGRRAWGALRDAVASGVLPDRELGDAALIASGGVLIALPGFVTDAVGLLAVAPPSRRLVRRVFGILLFRRAAMATAGVRLGSHVTRLRGGRGAGPDAAPDTAAYQAGQYRAGGQQSRPPAKLIQGEVIDRAAADPGDGAGRNGTGRDGTGRDGTGRDGTGRDGTGSSGAGGHRAR